MSGGPDYIDRQKLDRAQARHVVTFLGQALGHHVVKAGLDLEMMSYDHLRAYSGGRRLRESAGGGSFSEQRQFGYLTSPDSAVPLDSLRWKTNALSIGGFVQDSWSIADRVTLNVGVRYDAQYIYGGDGALALALPNQVSPRVGVIYDPTRTGRAKLFANYARFYESVPLDVTVTSKMDENYTLSNATGVQNGTLNNVTVYPGGTPRPLNLGDKNPNFLNPNGFQEPRTFRFRTSRHVLRG